MDVIVVYSETEKKRFRDSDWYNEPEGIYIESNEKIVALFNAKFMENWEDA